MKSVSIQSLPSHWAQTLQRVCEKELGNATEAREIVDDVWSDFLLRHEKNLRSPKAAWAYLRIACLRRCRRLREGQKLFDGFTGEETSVHLETQWIENIEEDAVLKRLSQCIEKLPAEWKEYVRLRFHFGLKLESLGQYFKVSKQYAGRVVTKAVAQLRLCLGGLS